jgi:3-oxoacyl-[acyl-carrier-protein] synthase II
MEAKHNMDKRLLERAAAGSDGTMDRPRVVITGMGGITPVGLTAEESWQSLLAGKSGIDHITSVDISDCTCRIGGAVKEFDARASLGHKAARRMARFTQFGVVAAGMALEDAGLALSEEEKEEVAVVTGTAVGGTVIETEIGLARLGSRSIMRASPNHLLTMLPNMGSFYIAKTLGLRGYNNSVTTACAAGTQAIGDAAELIRRGNTQVAVAGGCEATLSRMTFASFAILRALSTRNDDPAAASRPFDVDRDGFVMSEGAAIFVLESLEHAQQRGARIYAELAGYAANSDGFHVIAPNPEPSGPIKAMRQALADAATPPEQVDHINAHGTATPLGDIAETVAIKEVFGDRAYDKPISSNKSMIGHGLGSAGAMEMLGAVLAIRDNMIPPTINLDQPDPQCDLDYVPHTARAAQVDVVLKNSFGMGNQNACLVLRRFEPPSS